MRYRSERGRRPTKLRHTQFVSGKKPRRRGALPRRSEQRRMQQRQSGRASWLKRRHARCLRSVARHSRQQMTCKLDRARRHERARVCTDCHCGARSKKTKRFKRIQQLEPKVKIGDYEAKLKARRERAAQLKAQFDTMEKSFARLPELTPRVARTASPHYVTQHGRDTDSRGKRSARRRHRPPQQQQPATETERERDKATGALTPRAAHIGSGSSESRKRGDKDTKASGRKNVRVTPTLRPYAHECSPRLSLSSLCLSLSLSLSLSTSRQGSKGRA